ncbi:coat protein [ssRNA phage SRR7976299_11]|uniref:Coat protein n=1 Tax=ssRNA phage SRR7976299_11 TaxID=2786633 RepID=A0A8S5L0W5_9VIRU|nr:coat protein [ssRNA phage SRR7976299_11]DAD51084.1 TPA_asm: coat protein [ssRNA phage SRR7976299_11]
MPQIANITIKKNDGTTDIVYTAQAPSSGDGSPAVWKATTVGSAPAHQPEYRLTGREASKGQKRALRSTFVYPQIATNSTTGITSVVDKALAATDWVFSKGMSQADINEFVSQYANMLVSTLVKDCVKAGYSAS